MGQAVLGPPASAGLWRSTRLSRLAQSARRTCPSSVRELLTTGPNPGQRRHPDTRDFFGNCWFLLVPVTVRSGLSRRRSLVLSERRRVEGRVRVPSAPPNSLDNSRSPDSLAASEAAEFPSSFRVLGPRRVQASGGRRSCRHNPDRQATTVGHWEGDVGPSAATHGQGGETLPEMLAIAPFCPAAGAGHAGAVAAAERASRRTGEAGRRHPGATTSPPRGASTRTSSRSSACARPSGSSGGGSTRRRTSPVWPGRSCAAGPSRRGSRAG